MHRPIWIVSSLLTVVLASQAMALGAEQEAPAGTQPPATQPAATQPKLDARGVPVGGDKAIKTLWDFMAAAATTRMTTADVDKVLATMGEMKELEAVDELFDSVDEEAMDVPKLLAKVEAHAPAKAVLDKHGLTAREFMYKTMVMIVGMQRVQPGAMDNLRNSIQRTEKQLAQMKANPELGEQAQQIIPMMENALAMQKKMLQACEAMPPSTVKAIEARKDAIQTMMESE